MADARRAAVLPLRVRGRASPRLCVLRGQPHVRRVRRRSAAADADLPGTARRLGRSPHGRSVRADAAERHVVATGRRPSVDREPSAHLGRRVGLHGASRLTRRELLASFAVLRSSFFVEGAAPRTATDERRTSNGERRTQNEEPRTIRVGIARASGYAVSAMPLENYVSGVLAGEAVRGSAPAALEALAIAIRTFAFA